MKLNGSKCKLLLFAFLVLLFLPKDSICQSSTKRAGIGFRIDENPPVQKIHSYDSLFSIYGQKYSFAVTTYVLPLVPPYVDTLRSLAQRGIELMDNTPTHATQFFNVLNSQELNQYVNKPGVDHFNGQKVCLKYASYDTTTPHGEGNINLYGNKVISLNPGEFHDLLGPSPFFALYLKTPVNKLCLFSDVQAVNIYDPDTLFLNSFWDESYTSPTHLNFRYHKLMNNNVVMQDSALKILAQRSLHLFDSMNLARPVTWIQPDGQYPWINPLKIKTILGDKLDYQQSTSFINPSYFCYNEVNPQQTKQFSILNESNGIESGTFKANSHWIADAIARNYVVFDFARLTNSFGGWNSYLLRMDSLLYWCGYNNIPIKTYSQWKAIIYDSVPNKTINAFPKLNVDLDQDNWPDGFDHDTAVVQGVFDPSEGVQISDFKSFKLIGNGTICRVSSLGGLEKGNIMLRASIKASDTSVYYSLVKFQIYFPEIGQSINRDVLAYRGTYFENWWTLNIPNSVSIADFTFSRDTSYHDTLHISGFELRSTGFLSQSSYPLQTQTANSIFPQINVNNLIIDTIFCPPAQCYWTFNGAHSMWFTVDSLGFLHANRPSSFWIGKDSVWAIAHSPFGFIDSCFFRFRSNPIPIGCSGDSINISIMDTTTSSDYIRWTSFPYDSTLIDTTIINPTVSPVQTTLYRVKVYNLLGNIFKDSVKIFRIPIPVPGLFPDSNICQGRTIVLTAQGGGTYLWSTGDTTASISIKPDTLTTYSVTVTASGICSATDSTIINVAKIPVVTLSGLLPQYCATDPCTLMAGTPWTGKFGGNPGVRVSEFCPELATFGLDTVWFAYTSPEGCFNADTMYTYVSEPPIIPPLPDTNLIARYSITLHAGEGADNYLWSTGDITEYTVVDSLHHGLGLLKVWVYVTKGSCVAKDTARINFIPSGTNDLNQDGVFSIYPNPFKESITLNLKRSHKPDDNLQLINLSGEVLTSVGIKSTTTVIATETLPAGIYLLLLRINEKKYYLRMVKL